MAIVPSMENVEKELLKDPIGKVTLPLIAEGINEIVEANKVLLESEDGRTPKSEVLKAMKGDDVPEEIKSLVKEMEEAKAAFAAAQEKALNTYRVEVLKEEPVSEPDVDKERLADIRKTVMESVKFLGTYGTSTKKTSFTEWSEKVAVPQVGRAGTSTAGAKKPRVYVKVDNNETPYGSFTEAAAGLSTKDDKFTVAELTEAWNSANGGVEGTFEHRGHTFVITAKQGKKK